MRLTPTKTAVSVSRNPRHIDAASIEELIAPGDALLELPRPSLAVLVATLGVTEAAMLLKVPDSRIIGELKKREHCGERLLADIASWLRRHRELRNEGQWAPALSKAFADDVLTRAKRDVSEAVREAMRTERILPEDLAKRCGTSREAVASLLVGSTPGSLELVLRMAGALGIDVEVRVSPPTRAIPSGPIDDDA